MFTVQSLKNQYEWAHKSFDLMLDHCNALSNEELYRKLEGFGFNTVWAQLLHMAECELFWFRIANGQHWIEIGDDDYPDVVALRGLFTQARATAKEYMDQLSDASVNEPTYVEWEPGEGANTTPSRVITHVVTHGFHHKGQVVAMCRLLGHPAPETDLGVDVHQD